MYNNLGEKITEGIIMLINFKVKNVLSFKDLQEFSMVAGPTSKINNRLKKYEDINILKFSTISGANASGKSNFVKAIHLMKNIVLKSFPKFPISYYYKFQDKEKMDPSYFEVVLLICGELYSYGFEVDFVNNIIKTEWLFKIKNKSESMIFERNTDEAIINFGSKNIFNKEELEKLNFYKTDFINNKTSLLLSFLNNEKPSLYKFDSTKIFKELYNWFDKGLDIANPNTMITSVDYFRLDHKLEELSNIIKYFDTGIEKIDNVKKTFDEISKDIPKEIIDEIKDLSIEKMTKNPSIKQIGNIIRYYKNFWIINVSNSGEVVFEKICFYHEKEFKWILDLKDESDGTTRILDLAGVLLNDEKNKLFVIDELDRCLHPQLTCKFVELFLEKASNNQNNNQLIVTTHESRLMDLSLLRRDEIWFIDKKNNKSSLYSLEEYKERFDKKVDKAYIDGRYGGVPIFDEILLDNIIHNENKDKYISKKESN